jgi:pyruvate-formate lyase-activating enzyme
VTNLGQLFWVVYALFPCPYCHNTATGSGVEVSLAHGPAPRDETGHELTVATVWNAEALPELAFFQRELEGQLD